jgi:hypothetical protein
LTGTASGVTSAKIAGTYSGVNSCSGSFGQGRFDLAQTSAPFP